MDNKKGFSIINLPNFYFELAMLIAFLVIGLGIIVSLGFSTNYAMYIILASSADFILLVILMAWYTRRGTVLMLKEFARLLAISSLLIIGFAVFMMVVNLETEGTLVDLGVLITMIVSITLAFLRARRYVEIE